MNNFLELKKIFKNFKTEKTVKVLKNLSQKFDKGKSYSIMGPSGVRQINSIKFNFINR